VCVPYVPQGFSLVTPPGGGIDDVFTKLENGLRLALEMGGEFRRIGIKANAQERVILCPSGGE
jgi:hypothetical protein